MRRALLFAALALAGCASSGGTGAKPDTITFAISNDPISLNPLFAHPDSASVDLELARLSFEPFVDLDAAGKPQPALLAEIPTRANGGLSADGRTIRYRLRPGVHWSDGQPVTAADAAWTIGAILDPANPVRSHAGYELIDRYRALDSHTLEVHLRHAWGPAVLTFFTYGGTMPQFVLPAHVLRGVHPLDRAPFSSLPDVVDGPFKPAWWHRGEGVRYVANDRYYRGAPKTAALDARVVADPSTNLVMLQTGVLDWNLVAPPQVLVLGSKPNLRFTSTPTAVIAGLALNTRHAPLDDVRVRRALSQSIDRANISKKITLGKYPVTDQLEPQFSPAYDASIRLPAYDPKAADALFDAAGWRRGSDGMRERNGEHLHLTYAQIPESLTGVRVATAVQAELHARGVDVTIKSISAAQMFLPKTGTLAVGNFDLAYVPWTMGADPDVSSVIGCDAPANYTGWCDARVDALERQAQEGTDSGTRVAAYRQVDRIVADDVPVIYLFNARYIYAYTDSLTGFAPNAFVPTWNAWQWQRRAGSTP